MPPPEYERIRDALRERPLVPYERLETTLLRPSRPNLDAMLVGGWGVLDNRLETLVPPITWTHPNRSFEFHVHAWMPVTHLLTGWQDLGDERYLRCALDFCLDWLEVHQAPLLGCDRAAALDEAQDHSATKAWYDMGAGLRAYRLAYLADVVGRCAESDTEVFVRLFDGLRFHLDLLARDTFFVEHTNHGLYQALGQLAAARRFRFAGGFEQDYHQASARLLAMFDRSFFASGVHREHSPGYHHMILGSLLGARSSQLLPQTMDDRLERAEDALGWMIGPHGTLASIGDTDLKPRNGQRRALAYQNPAVQYLFSAGRSGRRPPDGIRGYFDAGVAFIRSGETYLAQTAAFHSRTHKHADHLSFLWWEGGEEVLIDPGRFGYVGQTSSESKEGKEGFWYSDPRRMYVERTRAHNCVEVDGRDYPRRGVRPFGSALRAAERQGELYVTTAETRYFRTVRHRRDLILHPGHFLLVLDWLYDRSGAEHNYRQWFQVAPQWSRRTVDEPAVSFTSASGALLWVANLLDPVEPPCYRGRDDPMSGWRSDKPDSLVPATSLHFDAIGSRGAFATLFLLGHGETTERTRGNQTLSAGRFEWQEGTDLRAVAISRVDGRALATLS